ncbi:MAG: terminase family protein [Erythrobacter sp.]|jgi:phage terminase large subunit-like protein
MLSDGFLDWLLRKDDRVRLALVQSLEDKERALLQHNWPLWRRAGQRPPDADWSCWLVCAGRGFGKTRAGAEWVRETAILDPRARIALVGASLGDARAVMVEGESGVLNISPPDYRPYFEPSLKRLTWPNGAMAFLYSAAEPDSLRGPQHSHAWCDEIGKWPANAGQAETCWDNLSMGLRLGPHPRIVATTTPRPTALVRRLTAEAGRGLVHVSRGSTYDNARNLPLRFVTAMKRQYGRTALGRQELDGELLEDIAGALWNRSLLERCRQTPSSLAGEAATFTRVVVGVDPPASERGDECGIVVCALEASGVAQVLADCSVTKASPERWARAVAAAASAWSADRVVAEANQGGAMVASVLRAAELSLPLKLVHASRGKAARAEPVAALYEAGRVRHAGMFAKLEDQLCGLMAGGGYEGPGRSPDRADALVWALSELMLGKGGRPRVRQV